VPHQDVRHSGDGRRINSARHRRQASTAVPNGMPAGGMRALSENNLSAADRSGHFDTHGIALRGYARAGRAQRHGNLARHDPTRLIFTPGLVCNRTAPARRNMAAGHARRSLVLV